jgi:GH15 family glucan-1,4-alpha-glucosidase
VTDSSRFRSLARRSEALILEHQAASGAYPASPTFPVYRFAWLRDGAFIADAMSRAGQVASADRFFDWCAGVIEARFDRIDQLIRCHQAGGRIGPDEYLHTRYTLDGEEADDEWWNHQLDSYGAWLWALGAHADRGSTGERPVRHAPAVEATARYLVTFWDGPCYDCWEESGDHVHVSTLAAIAAGLRVAGAWPGVRPSVQAQATRAVQAIDAMVISDGVRDGHLAKWLGGTQLDANLLFCAVPYHLFPPDGDVMRATVAALSPTLAHGGVHRHAADEYYGAGEWILLAACLGSYYAAVGDTEEAQAQLDWVAAQADDKGWLPEQVSSHLLHPEDLESWVDRWGPSATPLLWSHAMFMNLFRDLTFGFGS